MSLIAISFFKVYYLTEAQKYFDPINKVQKTIINFLCSCLHYLI